MKPAMRAVRIDEETARIVDALAAFLRRTKKSIVDEAVSSLLAAQRERIDAGAVAALDRLARAGTAAEGAGALTTIDSLPLSKRFALQRFAIRKRLEDARCAGTRVVLVRDAALIETDGAAEDSDDNWPPLPPDEGEVVLLIEYALGLDWVDRDELRRDIRRMLGGPVEFLDAERMSYLEQPRLDELRRTSEPI